MAYAFSKVRAVLRPVGLYFVPWLLVVLLFVPSPLLFESESAHPVGALRWFLHYAGVYLPWSVFALLIRALMVRVPLPMPMRARALLVHAAALVVLILGHVLLMAVFDLGLLIYARPTAGFGHRLLAVLLYAAPLDLILYVAVVAFFSALDSARRFQQRERHLAQAQLDALRAQIEPHFLFNVLNAVSELVYTDAAAADRALTQLASLLRRVLHTGGHEQSVREEVAQLREYASIHTILLGERLRIAWQIPPPLLAARVPTRLLQPLFENAVRHGIAQLREGGLIELSAAREGDRLILIVANAGPARTGIAIHEGVGLANTRARLQALYGAHQSMHTAFADTGGARVTIELPFAEGREA